MRAYCEGCETERGPLIGACADATQWCLACIAVMPADEIARLWLKEEA